MMMGLHEDDAGFNKRDKEDGYDDGIQQLYVVIGSAAGSCPELMVSSMMVCTATPMRILIGKVFYMRICIGYAD